MAGSIPSDAFPKWLRDIAIQVDELIQDAVVRKRVERAVREWQDSPEATAAKFLPVRALSNVEKLARLAAIHDAVSEAASQIDPWRHIEPPYKSLMAAPAYALLTYAVRQLGDEDRSCVENLLAEGTMLLDSSATRTRARPTKTRTRFKRTELRDRK